MGFCLPRSLGLQEHGWCLDLFLMLRNAGVSRVILRSYILLSAWHAFGPLHIKLMYRVFSPINSILCLIWFDYRLERFRNYTFFLFWEVHGSSRRLHRIYKRSGSKHDSYDHILEQATRSGSVRQDPTQASKQTWLIGDILRSQSPPVVPFI